MVMSTLKETRDLPLVCYVKRSIKSNEFAILYDVSMPKNSPFPYDNYRELAEAAEFAGFGRRPWSSTCFPLLAEVRV